jgi:hypothetical protein
MIFSLSEDSNSGCLIYLIDFSVDITGSHPAKPVDNLISGDCILNLTLFGPQGGSRKASENHTQLLISYISNDAASLISFPLFIILSLLPSFLPFLSFTNIYCYKSVFSI